MAMTRLLQIAEQITLAIIHISYGILLYDGCNITSVHSMTLNTPPYSL